MKRVIGSLLLLLGLSVFLLSFLNAARTNTVIDVFFALEPGEKFGPYEDETCYHATVLTKSTLAGVVLIEGGSINLTADGYNTQHLENVHASQNYSFIIDPADDLYTFTFDNSEGSVQSSIRFKLEERWVNIVLLISSFVGLLVLVPAGVFLIVRARLHKSVKELFHVLFLAYGFAC